MSKRNTGYLELKKLGDLIVNIDAFYIFVDITNTKSRMTIYYFNRFVHCSINIFSFLFFGESTAAIDKVKDQH